MEENLILVCLHEKKMHDSSVDFFFLTSYIILVVFIIFLSSIYHHSMIKCYQILGVFTTLAQQYLMHAVWLDMHNYIHLQTVF